MLTEKQNNVLKIIFEALNELNLSWMLIGSANHVIQGMDRTPSDIDLIVETKYELQKIENRFKYNKENGIEFKEYDGYSMYELNLSFDSIPVQIIGEYRRKDGQNVWGELDGFSGKKYIMYERMNLPCLSLHQEYNAYIITDRRKKAYKIKELIDVNSY